MSRSAEINTDAFVALNQAMEKIPSFERDGENPHFKSRFVTLDNILKKIKPILREHGLALFQIPFDSPNAAAIRTMVVHVETGSQIELGDVVVPVNKKDAQGYGSAMTYARRYGLMGPFCLTTGEDDDAAGASGSPPDDVMSVKVRVRDLMSDLASFSDPNDTKSAINKVRAHVRDFEDNDVEGWLRVEAHLQTYDNADSFMAFLNGDAT